MLFVLPEKAIHLRDLMQYQEPAPHDSGAGRVVVLTIQITAEHGDPQDGLPQRRNLLWWFRGAMYMAVQCLPFEGLQQYFARQVCVGPCEQGRIQDAPGDDGK